MTYYNTTNETGADLAVSVEKNEKNEKQEAVVLRLFQSVGEWQPSHIYEALKVYPITSIRRTLTDLTARGYLIKSGIKKKGMYGKSEHVWRIRS